MTRIYAISSACGFMHSFKINKNKKKRGGRERKRKKELSNKQLISIRKIYTCSQVLGPV
jgi:hypothetical protein